MLRRASRCDASWPLSTAGHHRRAQRLPELFPIAGPPGLLGWRAREDHHEAEAPCGASGERQRARDAHREAARGTFELGIALGELKKPGMSEAARVDAVLDLAMATEADDTTQVIAEKTVALWRGCQ